MTVVLAHEHYDAVRDLIEPGVDIDAAPGLPLPHQAVAERQPALVGLLLKRGADPTARDGMGRNARNLSGTDATAAATQVKALLEGAAK